MKISRQHPWLGREFQSGLVSVVIPVYNRCSLLIETLESVRLQTYRPIELIVVDDGSTDGTPEAVEDWMLALKPGDDLSVKLLRQDHQGAPAARNFGARNTKGEFIRWLDSDDLLTPRCIALCVGMLQRCGGDIASGPGLRFAHSGKRYLYLGKRNSVGLPSGLTPLEVILRGENVALPSLALYRRCLLVTVGPWDLGLVQFQDLDYALRTAISLPHLAYSSGAVTLRRVHSERQILHRRGEEIIESHGRVVEMTERRLKRAGLWNEYGPAFACFVTLRAIRARRWERELVAKWCERLRTLGAPSPPLEYGMLRLVGPLLGLRITREAWRAVRLLRRAVRKSRKRQYVPDHLLPQSA